MKTRRSPEVKTETFVCATPFSDSVRILLSVTSWNILINMSSVNMSRAKEATLSDPRRE